MSRITIWNHKQIKQYESPPVFTIIERKYFLRIPAALATKVKGLKTITNQIGFRLMAGYFMASKRFYLVEGFHQADILFLARQFGTMAFAFTPSYYKRQTYARHRQIILKHFGFESFDSQKHFPLVEKAIEEQITSYEAPQYILPFILEWLEQRQIELPNYHALQYFLTQRIRERNKKVSLRFGQLLEEAHKKVLNELFSKEENGFSRLHNLKKLSPSDNLKPTLANLDKLSLVWEGTSLLQPVLSKLELNDKAIRFFGELVLGSSTYQLSRRKEVDRYLLLTLFLAYQLNKFEDWMIDTFLSVCQTFLNKAKSEEKEAIYLSQKAKKQALKESVSLAQDQVKLIQEFHQILWTDEANLALSRKIDQLKVLLPLPHQAQYDQQADTLAEIREQHNLDGKEDSYFYLKAQSHGLQLRASPIVKQLHFDQERSELDLYQAIDHFCQSKGQINRHAPKDFLNETDQGALFDTKGKFEISLYKILLFRQVRLALKSGSLNLVYSFRYKAMDHYLIPKAQWEKDPDGFLDKANLLHLKDVGARIEHFRKTIQYHFEHTNERVLQKKNPHFRLKKPGHFLIKTPKTEKEKENTGLFPDRSLVSISEILATIEQVTGYLKAFQHWQPHYRKERPHDSLFFATIMAFGCNLGIPAMAQSSINLPAAQIENVANWYFAQENIQKANDIIVNFTAQLELANLYRKQEGKLRTSSDGQKIKVASTDTIYATYSFKYFGKGKGVSSYGFIDERAIPYYGTMINSSEREAPYVLDGMLHNPQIQSTFHVTDTHGFSEAIFGMMDLLGFNFAPIIAKLYEQRLYSFEKIASYQQQEYPVLPSAYVQAKKVENSWMEILRLACSLKLKYVLPSQIFKRFNSYSRQHPLYAALKEYGRMPKTCYILKYIDQLEIRQDARFMKNYAENNNKFNTAVFFNNGGEMIFLTRREQLQAEACKNLIKNAIICWNYLYLTRLIQQAKTPEEKKGRLEQIKMNSPMAWSHISFNGQYDFSEEYMSDSFDLLGSENYKLGIFAHSYQSVK